MTNRIRTIAVAFSIGGLALAGCANGQSASQPTSAATTSAAASSAASPESSPSASGGASASPSESAGGHMEGHDHPADGGAPPAGIAKATDPKFEVGQRVLLTAGHMPGMEGAEAEVVGAFDTTTYEVSYQPTDGGEPVKNHKWVVHEELVNPGEAPLPDGAPITIDAEHMAGMKGAKGTVDSSTDETVYMVNVTTPEMTMTNHKWMTESEMQALD